MATFYKCDGLVVESPSDPSALNCSTGWQKDVPVPLLSAEQANALTWSLIVLVVTVAIWRALVDLVR